MQLAVEKITMKQCDNNEKANDTIKINIMKLKIYIASNSWDRVTDRIQKCDNNNWNAIQRTQWHNRRNIKIKWDNYENKAKYNEKMWMVYSLVKYHKVGNRGIYWSTVCESKLKIDNKFKKKNNPL